MIAYGRFFFLSKISFELKVSTISSCPFGFGFTLEARGEFPCKSLTLKTFVCINVCYIVCIGPHLNKSYVNLIILETGDKLLVAVVQITT